MPVKAIQIRISGLDETDRALSRFGPKFKKLAILESLKAGGAVLRNQARRNAPKGKHIKSVPGSGGRLRKGISVFVSKKDTKPHLDKYGVYVGLRRGKGKDDATDAFYGVWVERGWNSHGRKATAAERAQIRQQLGSRSRRKTTAGRDIGGKWYMRKAFKAQAKKAVAVVVKTAKQFEKIAAIASGLKHG